MPCGSGSAACSALVQQSPGHPHAERRLKEAGLVGERHTDIGPGTPDVLVLDEPATGASLHLYTEQNPSGVAPTFDQRPSKLGHVAAFTPSTEMMRSFYESALGFRWSDTIGDFFVFLRCNADHHAANFMQSDSLWPRAAPVPSGAPSARPGSMPGPPSTRPITTPMSSSSGALRMTWAAAPVATAAAVRSGSAM
jgi:hypothetical protein